LRFGNPRLRQQRAFHLHEMDVGCMRDPCLAHCAQHSGSHHVDLRQTANLLRKKVRGQSMQPLGNPVSGRTQKRAR